MKPVIVSVASLGRENYNEAQLNMIKSCVRAGWDGDYMLRSVDGYCDNYMGVPIKLGHWPFTKKYGACWQHFDMNYQFKPHMVLEAYEAGYREIIWMDSTCRMLSNPNSLLGLAGTDHMSGIVTWDNIGHPVVNYTSDTAMKNMNVTVESLQGVKQIMACCIVFNFNNTKLMPIFEYWLEQSVNNSFYPDTTNRQGFISPRHDQAALSIILHKFNIPILDYGLGFCYYPNNETGEHINGNKIYIINKGVKD
jgi:hypothetical protein